MNPLSCTIPLLFLAATGTAQEEEAPRAWWSFTVQASLAETRGEWDAACDAFAHATEATDFPDSPLVWFFEGRAAIEARRPQQARAALERAADSLESRAHAWHQFARLHALEGELDEARKMLEAALAEGFYVPEDELGKDECFRDARREPWFRAVKQALEETPQRFDELADAGDTEGLGKLMRGLVFLWPGDERHPLDLAKRSVDELLAMRQKGKDAGAIELLRKRLLTCGEAGDRVFGNDGWSRWAGAMADLDASQGPARDRLWKDVDATTGLFRSHRFNTLMERFVPHEAWAREHDDLQGLLESLCALGLTRECLVEYSVKGYDAEQEWRRSWSDYDSVIQLSEIFGHARYLVDAFDNQIYLVAMTPNETVRQEFVHPQVVVPILVKLALHDLRRPPEERVVDGYQNWIADWGVAPE